MRQLAVALGSHRRRIGGALAVRAAAAVAPCRTSARLAFLLLLLLLLLRIGGAQSEACQALLKATLRAVPATPV